MSIHYIIKNRTMVCRFVGGARAVDSQAECLEDQILADTFELESVVTTEGSYSLVLYCDLMNSITRNTELLHKCYFAPIGYLVPIYPRSFHNMTITVFHLNYTKRL